MVAASTPKPASQPPVGVKLLLYIIAPIVLLLGVIGIFVATDGAANRTTVSRTITVTP